MHKKVELTFHVAAVSDPLLCLEAGKTIGNDS